MKLNEKYREVLRKELPWLPDLLSLKMEDFSVQVIDLDLLSLSPASNGYSGTSYYQFGTILLINGSGEVLGNVGRKSRPLPTPSKWWVARKWKAFMDLFTPFPPTEEEMKFEKFPETVEDAIKRIPGAGHTRFVLQLGHVHHAYQVILYKLPKPAESMDSWLQKKAEEDRTRIHDFLKEA